MPETAYKLSKELAKARSYVERGWCQGYPARTTKGKPCMSWNSDAVCWCASGAVSKATWDCLSDDRDEEMLAALTSALRAGYPGWEEVEASNFDIVRFWNDTYNRTREDVLQVFDAAIKVAEMREAQPRKEGDMR